MTEKPTAQQQTAEEQNPAGEAAADEQNRVADAEADEQNPAAEDSAGEHNAAGDGARDDAPPAGEGGEGEKRTESSESSAQGGNRDGKQAIAARVLRKQREAQHLLTEREKLLLAYVSQDINKSYYELWCDGINHSFKMVVRLKNRYKQLTGS